MLVFGVVRVFAIAVPPLLDCANGDTIVILAPSFTVRFVGTFQAAFATIVGVPAHGLLPHVLDGVVVIAASCKAVATSKPHVMFA